MIIEPSKLWVRTLTVAIVAIAGLGLTGCSLLNGVTNTTERDGDGDVVEGNEDADVFSIEVGDCLNDGTTTGTVTTAPIVPCDEPHDSEAYASVQMDEDEFPGDDAVTDAAIDACYNEYEDFVGIPWDDSKYDYSFYIPTEDSWNQLNDREILCTIYDPAGKITGSLAGVGE